MPALYRLEIYPYWQMPIQIFLDLTQLLCTNRS
jgi:hypothetical protein